MNISDSILHRRKTVIEHENYSGFPILGSKWFLCSVKGEFLDSGKKLLLFWTISEISWEGFPQEMW